MAERAQTRSPDRDFWLSATLELQQLDTVAQTATALAFTKWSFVEEDFIEALREGRRRLDCTGGGDDLGLSQEDATDLIDALERGERLKGVKLQDTGGRSFPVNPLRMFSNTVGADNVDMLPPWTYFNSATGCVTVQIVRIVSFRVKLDLRRYPYDRQVLPLFVEQRRLAAGKSRWRMLTERPNWAPGRYDDELHIVSQSLAGLGPAGFSYPQPFAYFGKKASDQPALCLCLERNPGHFVTSVMIPVSVVGVLGLGACMLTHDEPDTRYNAALTTMLTLTAYRASLEGLLPQIAYTTFADWYFLLGYIFHVLIVIKVIVFVHMSEVGVGFFGTNPAENPVWDSDTQMLDSLSTWFLLLLWVVPHAMLILDLVAPWLLSKRLRIAWPAIIERTLEVDFRKSKSRGSIVTAHDVAAGRSAVSSTVSSTMPTAQTKLYST